jgi:hypothetical protein
MIDESGTYVVAENLLTVIPQKSTTTVKNRVGFVAKETRQPIRENELQVGLALFCRH